MKGTEMKTLTIIQTHEEGTQVEVWSDAGLTTLKIVEKRAMTEGDIRSVHVVLTDDQVRELLKALWPNIIPP